MKILLVHSRYRSGNVSGENRVVADELRLLRTAGHSVEVMAFDPDVETRTERASTAINAIWSRRAQRLVSRAASHSSPDVIHLHNPFPSCSPSVFFAGDDVPLVATLHNYRLFCLAGTLFRDGRVCEDCVGRPPWPGVVHACYRSSVAGSATLATSLLVLRRVHGFDRITLALAVSEFLRRKYVEAGFGHSRMVVKPNFAWPAEQRDGPGKHFLFVGRLSPEKGVRTLLQAWRDSFGELVIVGDGPDAGPLRRGAPSSARFVGPLGSEDLRALIAQSRALIVPSEGYETFGKVVVESYASGVPVIAARSGALPEVVQSGATGILVRPRDPTELRNALERLLDDPESERMGAAAGQLWRERFTPERNLRELEAAYSLAGEVENARTPV